MPNRNIYVKEEDAALFDRANEIPGTSLSSVIADALRAFLDRTETEAKEMKKITLDIGLWGRVDAGEDDNIRKIGFVGMPLTTMRENLDKGGGSNRSRLWKAFLTKKRAGVIWCCYDSRWQGERTMADYAIVTEEDLESGLFTPEHLFLMTGPENEAADPSHLVTNVPAAIAAALRKAFTGSEVEELDI